MRCLFHPAVVTMCSVPPPNAPVNVAPRPPHVARRTAQDHATRPFIARLIPFFRVFGAPQSFKFQAM